MHSLTASLLALLGFRTQTTLQTVCDWTSMCASLLTLAAPTLQQMNGQLEFYNVEEAETMATGEHFMCTDIEWDPTGRYVATVVTSIHQMENGFNLWSWNGNLMYRWAAPSATCGVSECQQHLQRRYHLGKPSRRRSQLGLCSGGTPHQMSDVSLCPSAQCRC